MERILQATRAFLEADGWLISSVEDGGLLRVGYAGRHGRWGCLAWPREDANQLIFYSVCPLVAPEDTRPRLAEYLTRVNWGLPIGAFEMNFLSGEIRFRTSVAIEGMDLYPALIRPLLYGNVHTMDAYIDDIGEVIAGNLAPDAPDGLHSGQAR
jgi:hypothetical protein